MYKKPPYVVVFVPCYNEGGSVGRMIKTIQGMYSNVEARGYQVEVIVVDDGSNDNTEAAALEAGVVVARHPYNRGLGAATRTGLQRAREMGADIAVKIDADFQHDPADIDKVVRPILDDKADAVFGSRFLGQITYTMPLYRRLGNTFFSFLVGKLTGLKVTDGQTGLMAFSSRYLKDFNIISDYNETQQLIMDCWNKHMRILEVPVVFHPRLTGKSFISFRYPFKVLPTILRFLVLANPLQVFLPVGLLLLLSGCIVGGLVLQERITVVGETTSAILIIGGVQIIMLGLLADAVSNKR